LSNRNVHLVSPSKWLANQVEKASPSKLGNPILVVPNPVPEQIELDKTKIRNEMNLFGKTVIGFISMIPENPNKGLSQLLKSLNYLDANIRQKVVLLIVGGRKTPEIPSNLEYRHVRQDEFGSVSNIYSAIDILAVPSLQDNSPNVIAEALCNNVRIVGSSFGGIPELLQRFNQSIVDVNDHQSFKEEIKRLVENAFEPINVSTEAKNFFSYENHATTLLKAYEHAINK
jgi:glycosyltransferase involved in cell wall biosynthesis